MTDTTLFVCGTEADVPDGRSAVVLSRILRRIDSKESTDLYRQLVNLDINHNYDLPVYSIVATQIWRNGSGIHGHVPFSVELLIPLYKELAEQVNPEIDRIECIGVSGRYRDLLRDLAAAENVTLIIREDDPDRIKWTDLIYVGKSLVRIVASVFDLVLTILLLPFFESSDADTLVKYPVFRPDTFRPIEDRLKTPFDTTFTLLTASYFLRVRKLVSRDSNTIPIRCLDTVDGLLTGYRQLATISYDLLVSRRIETAVVEAVAAETGVQLDRTVGRLFRRAAISNLQTYLYYCTAERVFSRGEYQDVVLTSTGPTGKSMALAAQGNGVQTFVLHHSVTTPVEFLDETFNRTVFTEGQIAETVLPSDSECVQCIPVGLPKHLDIADRRKSSSDEVDENGTVARLGSNNMTDFDGENDEKTLLVGTQPLSKEIRRELVTDLVPAVLNKTSWKIVIKTHPAEDSTFYSRILRSMGIELGDRVRVDDENLYDHIRNSDLLLTVTSNVAVEAIILGTPAASYNVWTPLVEDPVYVKANEIPVLRTPGELIELLDQELTAVVTDQQNSTCGSYMIDGNSLDQITDRIDQELCDVDSTRGVNESDIGPS
jgi:hypothetical protein